MRGPGSLSRLLVPHRQAGARLGVGEQAGCTGTQEGSLQPQSSGAGCRTCHQERARPPQRWEPPGPLTPLCGGWFHVWFPQGGSLVCPGGEGRRASPARPKPPGSCRCPSRSLPGLRRGEVGCLLWGRAYSPHCLRRTDAAAVGGRGAACGLSGVGAHPIRLPMGLWTDEGGATRLQASPTQG